MAVIPIIVGPLQVLMALLPVILVALGSAILALFRPRTIKLLLRLLWRTKGTVILVLAGAAVLWFGVRRLWPAGRAIATAADVSTNSWALFRGNAQRTGAVPGTESPRAGRINWAFAEVKTIYSSPAVVGNRVYVTTAEKGPFVDRGAIYCLDADTGAVVWKAEPDGYLATFSSPSVSGSRLVVGEGLHMTREARVVCLDIAKNGVPVWSYVTKSHVESSPVIADGRVYIGAGDDGYYCFRLEPDERGKPVVEWHLRGDNYRDAETSPAVAGGSVFFGLGVNGHALVCADAATGKELWRVATPSPVFTAPALSGGKVFVGMGHGNVVRSEEEVIADTRDRLHKEGKSESEVAELTKDMNVNGAVWCVNQSTNRVEWKFQTDRTVLGGVAVEGDRVFAATRAGTVYALGPDGREVARWEARVPIIASPAATPECVYVVATDGRLYGLDRNTLKPVWQVALGSGANYVSSPAVARGHVYVGTTDKGLLCVGAPGGRAEKILWAGAQGGGTCQGNVDGSTVPETGNLFWLYPQADDTGKTRPPRVTGPMAVMGNRLYAPMFRAGQGGVLCLEFKPGAQTDPVEKWFHATSNNVTMSPVTDGSSVFFVDGSAGTSSVRRIHCVKAESGETLWSAEVWPGSSGALTLTADSVLTQDATAGMTCFRYDGSVRWLADVGRSAASCAVGDGILVVAAEQSGIRALDPATGRLLWQREPGARPVTAPVVADRRVIVGTDSGVEAFSLVDGRGLWSSKSGAPSGGVVASIGDSVVYTRAGSGLVVLGVADGKVRRTAAGAVAGVPPLATRDAIVYAARDNLMVLRPDGEKSAQWMDISWLGTLVSPPVLSESSVFFASDQYGIVCAGKGRQ